MKRKKEQAVLLHILFVLFLVAGVSIMYNNPHYGEGISWLTQETYEDTSEFTTQIRSDIEDIFTYVNYKEVFETDGKLDYSKPVLQVAGGPGESKTYTIDEMIRLAKSMGYYLNENFKVKGRQASVSADTGEVKVEWRSYSPNQKISEPGDAYSTMDKLAKEVMSHVGNYYGFYYKFLQNPSNLKFRIAYTESDSKSESLVYTNTIMQSQEEFKALGKYMIVMGDQLYLDTNLYNAPESVSSLLEKNNPYNNNNYYMMAAVNTAYPFSDSYSAADLNYEHTRFLYIIGLVSLSIGFLGCAASIYYLICLSGHTDSSEKIILTSRLDRIPAESTLPLFLLLFICSYFTGERLLARILHLFLAEEYWYFGELAINVLILYAVCLAFLFSMLRRYKAGTLWERSLCCKTFENIKQYFKNHRFTTRLIICYIMFLFTNLAVIVTGSYVFFTYDSIESRILIMVLTAGISCLDIWVFHQMYKNAWGTDRINDAVLRVSKGDTTYKINTSGFLGKEKVLAENINHISRGLETALQEKVQSERLKADLITNVSHDIKTPLTSIINYVDLIKREHITNPKIEGYLDILEQKSQRLKTLTEDLVEASKASSGNLKLEIADIDFVELIHQTNGEFEEKFVIRHLEMVTNFPQEVVLIQADGRYLWRVLENLYNNTFKYAMEHSRVYTDIIHEDDKVLFTIKNVSENSLNINADELTERFVRGDVARTTEGSGLGLSIARSLTELQGGQFDIYIDGDLFKAIITFPVKKART